MEQPTPVDLGELLDGNPDKFALAIEKVYLRDGSMIKVPSSGVTVVVGANNSGKSTLLREIVAQLSRAARSEIAYNLVLHVRIKHSGSGQDAIAWFKQNVSYTERAGYPIGFITTNYRTPIPADHIARAWTRVKEHSEQLGSELHNFLLQYLEVGTRLNLVGPQPGRPDFTDPPGHPFHYLEDDSILMAQLSAASEKIFRTPLTFDQLGVNRQLRVGKLSIPAPPIDSITAEYRKALSELPPLSEQGDGMKSLFGLLCSIMTSSHRIFIIDEPEAFLHPPQALALGQLLGDIAKDRNIQIILATHDKDLLTGILSSAAPVSVVRLDRSGNSTAAHQLNENELRDVWSDPVLRYSNVLDGLFHKLVVLAEADQDCRFYAAALDYADTQNSLPVAPSDILFVPSGGKDGLGKLAKALNAVHVPVVASPDLDILNDKVKLRNLATSFGGEWATIESLYSQATNHFREPRAPRTVTDVYNAITAALSGHLSERYNAGHKKVVSAHLYVESPFSDLKSQGDRAFRNGQEAAAAEQLFGVLESLGIVVVRVGELENFARLVAVGKGPEWLPAALEAGAHKGADAQEHIRRMLAVHASVPLDTPE